MTEIVDHKTNECNEDITIVADDRDPKNGNASHEYRLRFRPLHGDPQGCDISFQNGPINEVGVNGVTNEALIAVVIDRLRGFQSGAYACRENALALTKLEEGLMWLALRTRLREARGVEGTSAV
jgi:hypothetical protein